jgi:eukaryotic-like serine/threonine-protein kinase
LATGRHPFENGSILDMLQAINGSEPAPPSLLNPFVPAQLDAVILRMLAKGPAERLTALEVARALESRSPSQPFALPANSNQAPAAAPSQWPLSRRPSTAAPPAPKAAAPYLPWIMAAAALAGLAIVGALYLRKARVAVPEIRADIVVPTTDHRSSFAMSPDGRRIAYAAASGGATRLWVRDLDSTSAHALPGTEGAISPFWSPDSKSLASSQTTSWSALTSAGRSRRPWRQSFPAPPRAHGARAMSSCSPPAD